MIRDAQGKLAITPGDWHVKPTSKGTFVVFDGEGYVVAEVDCCNPSKDAPTATLISEAGTVTNATGRTPAELRDLVRELREALDFVMSEYVDLCDGVTDFANRDAMEELLKKSEGV